MQNKNIINNIAKRLRVVTKGFKYKINVLQFIIILRNVHGCIERKKRIRIIIA